MGEAGNQGKHELETNVRKTPAECAKSETLTRFLRDLGDLMLILKVTSRDKTHCNKFSLLTGLIVLA